MLEREQWPASASSTTGSPPAPGRGGQRVLIVEDRPEVAQWLRTELFHAGWVPDTAPDGATARAKAQGGVYDIILLDIMLPDEDGFRVAAALRQVTAAPIIMVTARQALEDRVRALDGGADDYLAKPFAVEELLARMRAVLRRVRGRPAPVLEVGDLRIRPEERQAEQGGRPLPLGRREFDLLRVLAEHENRVLSREQLLEQAWGYEFYGESNVVDVTVRRLREHLDPQGGVVIAAVRGVGYVLRRKAERP
ncbi:Transcriptional regulatory protein TcrA [Candidatus Hydrogenisulfobacillus filiaventi]|uniref:Stage 0 sporulation protein A homolog n=1 Tax=Candidatus Hydrogenisulfobacillus filiaventi TaxID=2707344 RepID=A0A6F8ZGV2_9FIRM|nr:response regulator transcription factor [Bacillota bacterium]CAB1129016.1 Transcriptional regulatory protein TcrA [Candidatus Hydrogenisulfobacillus filiaventi]